MAYALLLFVPLSLAPRYLFEAQPLWVLWVFLTDRAGACALYPLAGRLGANQGLDHRRGSIDFKFNCEFRIIECLYLVLPSMPTQNFKERGP
jgi:hypothetical protein